MISEETPLSSKLHHGICGRCGEESDDITEDGYCVDCIAEVMYQHDTFYLEAMKGL